MNVDLLPKLRELVAEAADLTDAPPIKTTLAPDSFLPDFLDSIGLTTLLTLIEDEWDLEFEDHEISHEMFETLGTLATAIGAKRSRPTILRT